MKRKNFLRIWDKVETFEFLDDEGAMEGYGSVFDNVTRNGVRFVKGCFSKTIQDKKKFPFLWGHDLYDIIGGVTNCREDDYGLRAKFEFSPDVAKAKEIYSHYKNGIIDGLSVGVQILNDSWNADLDCLDIRECKLIEISATPIPANEKALVDKVFDICGEDTPDEEIDELVKRVHREYLKEAAAKKQEAPTFIEHLVALKKQTEANQLDAARILLGKSKG